MRRLVTLLALIAATLSPVALSSPATAADPIWTQIASGTVQDITAVDAVAPGDTVYATAGGQILRNGVVQASFAGVSFSDIAMNPAGTRGLATANLGRLYRFNGTSWSQVSLTNTTFDHECPGGGTFLPSTPTGDLNAVTYATPTTAYVVGDDDGMVLRVVGDGAPVITDVSRRNDGTCRADPVSGSFSDIVAVTDQLIYLLTDSFGARVITANAFASTAARRDDSSVNCFGVRTQIAVDVTNPSRSFVTAACTGGLQLGYSSDTGTTYELGLDYPAGGQPNSRLNGVALAGGAAVVVGEAGTIVVSLDGRNAFPQPAGGTLATNDWLAVDKTSANDAVVGGRGGALITTSRATTTVTPPAPAPPAVPPPGSGATPGTTVATIGGVKVTLKSPAACVRVGKKFTVKVSGKKISSVTFSLGSRRLGKVDRRAPYKAKVATAKLKPGKTYRVKAKVTIGLGKGRSVSKTIKTAFTTC